ncbi:hypothetical protein EXQ27_10525 [Clostridium botulinum]|uniref:hypothetical protein n=1 Tax=Clostridium botulinum TaxID=1491 RepID=UPI001A9388C2|nr:hypothetical protein [Clostridium botulinum]MBO0539037.1 hypothetical protein [Clostridium botulinum]MBO0578914.1 hypothetical protein [Clostridium botulinum]
MMVTKQTEANKKWYSKNKEYAKYLNKRSHAKNFIKIAKLEDLEELQKLIEERKELLRQE